MFTNTAWSRIRTHLNLPIFWMISLRDNGGTGANRNKSGPTFWVSDNDDTSQIANWQRLPFAQFRKELIDACDQFPDLPQEQPEEEKHVALLIHGYTHPWLG